MGIRNTTGKCQVKIESSKKFCDQPVVFLLQQCGNPNCQEWVCGDCADEMVARGHWEVVAKKNGNEIIWRSGLKQN